MTLYLQTLTSSVLLDGTALPYVFDLSWSGGWQGNYPTARITIPEMPATGGKGDTLQITAQSSERFNGYCSGFEFQDNPPTVTVLGAGQLWLAESHLQANEDGQTPEDIVGVGFDPTDQNLISAVLTAVGGITVESLNILGTGETTDPDGNDWPKWEFGQSALEYIRAIDQASQTYRTYELAASGVQRRQASLTAGTLADSSFGTNNVLRGSTGGQDTYHRASLSTYIEDVLEWGSTYGASLSSELGVSGSLRCQNAGGSLGPQGWTQTVQLSNE